MSTDSGKHNTLPKIRTFAADLERTRHKDDDTKNEKQHTKDADVNASIKKDHSPKKEVGKNKPEPKVSSQSPIKEEKSTPANPPFHTIKKGEKKRVSAPLPRTNNAPLKIDTSEFEAKQTKEKPSVLESVRSKEVTMDDFKDGSEGTIITDTKRKRFRFFPSLIESIRTSLIEFGEIFTGSKKRTYSVPDTDRRKGVIQTATSRTGRFATGDHSEVVKRLKERKHKTEPAVIKNINQSKKSEEKGVKRERETEEVVTKNADAQTEKGASKHTQTTSKLPTKKGVLTDPARLLEPADDEPVLVLEEPDEIQAPTKDEIQKITDVKIEPRKSVATQRAVVPQLTPVVPHQPVPTPPPAPIRPAPEPTPAPEPVVAVPLEPIRRSEPAAPVNDSFVQPPVMATMSSGALNNFDAIEEEQAAQSQTIEEYEPEPEPTPDTTEPNVETSNQLSETNLLAVGAVVSILLVFTAFLVIRATFGLIFENNSAAEVTRPTAILENSIVRTVTVSEATAPALFTAIKTVSQGDLQETTQITPILQRGGGSIELTPAVTLELLSSTADPSFIQAVNKLAFGARVNGKPFVILHVSDTTTIRGGLLTWEPQMRTDLTPLFDIPTVASSTASALTPFADANVNDIDVRILEDAQGEHIVYGFITPNIVVISASITDFSGVASLVQE